MNENPEQVLLEVFTDILESQAFMFSDMLDEVPSFPGHSILVGIRFSGPIQGELCMAMPVDLSLQVAANMLGLEPEDELAEHRANDAVKELLNVACGHVLTGLAGEEPVFDLAVPTLMALDEIGWNKFVHAPGCMALSVEDVPVVVRLITQ